MDTLVKVSTILGLITNFMIQTKSLIDTIKDKESITEDDWKELDKQMEDCIKSIKEI